jgi:hypothetical protein
MVIVLMAQNGRQRTGGFGAENKRSGKFRAAAASKGNDLKYSAIAETAKLG